MAGYEELLATLAKLKGDVASFRKVILHAHSLDSYDYGGVAGISKKDKIPTESSFVEAINASELDLVAITDHMKCDFACRLSESPPSSHICILPGMEVNLRPPPPWNTFRLHILVIFPEKYSLERVCKILPSDIPDERKRNGREEIKSEELSSFIRTVHECGGLCIAAHIDTDRGVRRAFKQLGRDGIVFYDPNGALTQEEEKQISEQFKDWILSAGFDAIEVSKDTDKKHYRWISEVQGQTVSIPVLLKNDAHCGEDLLVEERITHIKMTSACFEGLKQALQFPDTRIRFPSDVPKSPSPRILGIEIIAGNEKGFFKNLQIAFSDNLTCLIGPRGSGKSSIIESLRYVFGYNRTLDQIEQPGADLAKKVRSLQEATLTNCVIRVVYCAEDREPHIHVLEAAYDSKQDYSTRVYTKDGEEQEIHDVESSGLFPLRLFGWSEIETLGREAHRQRELLDRLIPGLFEKLEQRNELRSKMSDKRRTIESSVSTLLNIMRKNQGEIKRYKEYKVDFEKLNTEEVKVLFVELDTARIKELVLTKLKANVQNWLMALGKIAETDLFEGVNELLPESSEQLKSWWSEKKRKMKFADRQSDVQNEIGKGVNTLRDLVNELDIDIGQIKQEIQEKDKAIREKVSEEAAKQVATELRRTAGERLKRVEKLKRDYNKEWKLFNDLLGEWLQITRELTDLHDEISGKRMKRKDEIETRLNQFGTTEMKISLKFSAGGDRSKFESHIRDSGFLSRELHGNYKANLWPEKIAMTSTPVELAESILTKKPDRLIKSVTVANVGEFGVDKTIAERLITTLYPFSQDEDADIPSVDEQKIKKILSMAEVEWDDFESILLNERPVEHLSPGQRSSAMLPLIALVENTPLVIDQPEDNLDNRLIGKMLVDILADLKEKRQIIVATHNPNIVVSGDAEQLIVLEALSESKGICARSGSIDKEEIVDSVIEIMEGGKEAFLTRRRRYGLD
jgi:ABC-type cobalamin/Fe3+-siderophores transport system ATPase subunit